jgi:hypothetical protein
LIRVVHELVDLVLRPQESTVDLSLHMPDEPELRQLALVGRMWQMLERGGCDLELRIDGLRPFRAPLGTEFRGARLEPAHRDVLSAAMMANEVARRVGLSDTLMLSENGLSRAVRALQRTSVLFTDASSVRFLAKIPNVPVGSLLALLVVNWLVMGREVVVFHGILVGKAEVEPDGETVRVERASNARRDAFWSRVDWFFPMRLMAMAS